jgi:hypothetical protein
MEIFGCEARSENIKLVPLRSGPAIKTGISEFINMLLSKRKSTIWIRKFLFNIFSLRYFELN